MFRPWVEMTQAHMDGDGAFWAWPWPGTYLDQPDFDVTVMFIIRGRWNELTTERMQRK